jgi:pilus assembly protein CpaF
MGIFGRNRNEEAAVPEKVHAATASAPPKVVPKAPQSRQSPADRARQDLKLKIHRELLQRIDLTNLLNLDPDQATSEVKQVILALLAEQPQPMSTRDRAQLAEEIHAEVYGLGPLEPLMRDPDISDVLVNGPHQVYVERFGKLELTPVIFRDNDHLMQIIDRIVSSVGRRVDESSPMVDARLADGSRVNAIIPPLALDGASMSIRRFAVKKLDVETLMANNSISQEMVNVLQAMVSARLNVLVIGGTGSGKTTLLNCLSGFIPEGERIVTIEDSAELQLQQAHVVRLETRPANIEGKGEINARELVRNALRMRPDRIVVGEVRGAEALDMLQAMNTGHDGSISTVHANNARDALGRLEMMLQMAGLSLPLRPMRQQIASAVDVLVVAGRLSDGTRKVLGISEIVGMEGDSIMLQDLFAFERDGYDENGKIVGRFQSTGIRPHFLTKLKASSHEIDLAAFDYLND